MALICDREEEEPEDHSPTLSEKLSRLVLQDQLKEQEQDEEARLTVNPVQEGTSTEECTTPTSKEHRIPDFMTCPPAPRKRKVVLPEKDNGAKKFNVLNVQLFKSPELDAVFGNEQECPNNGEDAAGE
ncbi:hypothetical protein K2173_003400 [Erythroxylum novogranatense]|uniref:Uncharacterized protein n=1 Tax=Erythroxylum novogranatense TaxID=1862640 RepID=A0AAV8S8R0_9ROSI|nr:hypothetical protein K2173_003400 [Erythroxylum novogranatense]